jgi:hypothetical protein
VRGVLPVDFSLGYTLGASEVLAGDVEQGTDDAGGKVGVLELDMGDSNGERRKRASQKKERGMIAALRE